MAPATLFDSTSAALATARAKYPDHAETNERDGPQLRHSSSVDRNGIHQEKKARVVSKAKITVCYENAYGT